MHPVSNRAHSGPRTQRGLSLVELMVGITVGLFIVAAAAMMASGQLGDNRRLMLELQVQQELRSAMDLMNRDVRRASGWDQAASGVWRANNLTVGTNPNTPIATAAGGTAVQYSYITAGAMTPAGFRLQGDALQMRVGDAWQSITDAQTVLIQQFSVDVREEQIDLAGYCINTCSSGSCPQLTVRNVDITLVARAPQDAQIQRTLQSTLRLPNDRVTGACP